MVYQKLENCSKKILNNEIIDFVILKLFDWCPV